MELTELKKRVCELTLVGASGEQFPIEVIIPADSIPTPRQQNMECFKKYQGQKGKARWIGKITEEDINKLPLILLGLNYQKYFPREIPKSNFTKSFQKANPGMAFFTSIYLYYAHVGNSFITNYTKPRVMVHPKS